MKTLMIFLLLVFSFSNLTAQRELQAEQQLNEAEFTYKHEVKVKVNPDNGGFKLSDEHMEQFLRDPVKFCDENIDITGLTESIDSEDNERFVVKLKSKNGYVKATYNRKGELQSTFQKFEDRVLPLKVRQKLFNDYKGWTITKNRYTARGEGNRVNKEKWRISISKGNLIKNVNINPAKISEKRIAGN